MLVCIRCQVWKQSTRCCMLRNVIGSNCHVSFCLKSFGMAGKVLLVLTWEESKCMSHADLHGYKCIHETSMELKK